MNCQQDDPTRRVVRNLYLGGVLVAVYLVIELLQRLFN